MKTSFYYKDFEVLTTLNAELAIRCNVTLRTTYFADITVSEQPTASVFRVKKEVAILKKRQGNPIPPLSCHIPLALELDIYSLQHHLCKMLIFYEPRRVTLGNT